MKIEGWRKKEMVVPPPIGCMEYARSSEWLGLISERALSVNPTTYSLAIQLP
jgi:hypothetical protein